jgi:hypothetical protein
LELKLAFFVQETPKLMTPDMLILIGLGLKG